MRLFVILWRKAFSIIVRVCLCSRLWRVISFRRRNWVGNSHERVTSTWMPVVVCKKIVIERREVLRTVACESAPLAYIFQKTHHHLVYTIFCLERKLFSIRVIWNLNVGNSRSQRLFWLSISPSGIVWKLHPYPLLEAN